MPAQSSYVVSLLSRTGVFVQALDNFQTLSLTRTVDAVGALSISLPYSDQLWNATPKDAIIDVWRKGSRGGQKRVMGGVWFVVKRDLALAANGARTITLGCVDQMDLLRRFCILYDTSTPQATKVGAAETLVKGVVSDNLLAVSLAMSRVGLAQYLTVETDGARGYNPIAIAASWQNCLSVCTQVARSSTQYGSYIAFDFEAQAVNPPTFIFRCYTGQRGVDRSPGSPMPLVLSDANGAFGAANYSEDFSTAPSFVLCGGQSSGTVTSTGTAVNTTLDTASPFAHTETYVSQLMSADTDTLQVQANDGLRLNRPVLAIGSVVINQADNLQMGVDFDWGDRLTARLANQTLTCRLESLTLTYDAASGKENLTGTLRSEYSP